MERTRNRRIENLEVCGRDNRKRPGGGQTEKNTQENGFVKERTTEAIPLANMRSNSLKETGSFGADVVSRTSKGEVGGILSLKISGQLLDSKNFGMALKEMSHHRD